MISQDTIIPSGSYPLGSMNLVENVVKSEPVMFRAKPNSRAKITNPIFLKLIRIEMKSIAFRSVLTLFIYASASSVSSPLVSALEITIRVDESECLSMASSHDQETERFLSTGTTGRRVSFNEAALYDHGKKAQEKGRRSDRRRFHFCFVCVCINFAPQYFCVFRG